MSPFPRGLPLPDGRTRLGRPIAAASDGLWLHALQPVGRAIVLTPERRDHLVELATGLELSDLPTVSFGGTDYPFLRSNEEMDQISRLARPTSRDEAMRFARALAAMPDGHSSAIFCREHEVMVPFDLPDAPHMNKALALGRYLSGGVEISAEDVVALDSIVTDLDIGDIEDVVVAAGMTVKSAARPRVAKGAVQKRSASANNTGVPLLPFSLPGRAELEAFFNEHVVDIVANEARYAALGIGFPGGVILEGPTGCGKTFAVEKLVEHLDWPSFSVDASSVASPYIHETSRKVAEVFASAIKAAPAVIVIDEMDAFLADRDVGNGHHRVEEVAEFLRRIPEASAARVLIIGMTNKIDMIDPAILRRGRFDHVIHVDHAGPEEIEGLLTSLLRDIPHDLEHFSDLARGLAGRPLSDVAFVVREAGRLAARAGKDRIALVEIEAALARSPSRNDDDKKRIGFG